MSKSKAETNQPKIKWGFVITGEPNGNYYHLNLTPVYVTDQGMLDWPGRSDMGALAAFKITCQCDNESKTSYGWKIIFDDTLSHENYEAVAALMKKVTRAMQKMQDEDGPAESYGRFCFRAAKAMGATFFVKRLPGRDIKEHSYFMPLADGILTINQALHAWVDANYRERDAA
jgi:hypothetical protein